MPKPYYSRIHIAAQLLPLLQKSRSLGRIVAINGGSSEGKVVEVFLDGPRVSLLAFKAHTCMVSTLGLEALAQRSGPKVSIITTDPGVVRTRNQGDMRGLSGVVLRLFIWLNQ